jgi:hypothetical protein
MVAVQFETDVAQGFSFKSGVHVNVGYLITASFGGTVLHPDLKVIDPTTMASMSVAGVLSQVQWEGNQGDPVLVKAQISTANLQLLELLLRGTPQSAMTADFRVYKYDGLKLAYFCAFQPATPPLSALIEKQGTTLS